MSDERTQEELSEELEINSEVLWDKPSPPIPEQFPANRLKDVEPCMKTFGNMMACLLIEGQEVLCADQIMGYKSCRDKRDMIVHKRILDWQKEITQEASLSERKGKLDKLQEELEAAKKRAFLYMNMDEKVMAFKAKGDVDMLKERIDVVKGVMKEEE